MTIEFDPLETQHTDLDASFRRHAFQELRKGVAVAATELVAGNPSGTDTGRRTLNALLQRGMAELDGGEVVAIDGLSIRSTKHRMNLGGEELFTWCATDAIGIPTALDENADVTTTCPHCSSEIAIAVREGKAEGPEDIVLWLPTSSCSHVVSQFCPEVNLFCSRTHLDEWRPQEDRGEGRVLSVQEVAELGRQWWAYLRLSGEGVEIP